MGSSRDNGSVTDPDHMIKVSVGKPEAEDKDSEKSNFTEDGKFLPLLIGLGESFHHTPHGIGQQRTPDPSSSTVRFPKTRITRSIATSTPLSERTTNQPFASGACPNNSSTGPA